MTTSRPSDNPSRPDDLKQRYLQASTEQIVGPSERVRRAALDHARMVAASTVPAAHVAPPQAKPAAAANRWNFALVASVAIAGISALLALQFDRSDSEDKAVVLGMPSVTAPPVAVQTPASPPPAVATNKSAATDAANTTASSTTQPENGATAEAAPKSRPLAAAKPQAKEQAAREKSAPATKESSAEALSTTAPAAPAAPAVPLMKSKSKSKSKSDSESETQPGAASADQQMQAAPTAAQSRSAPPAAAPAVAPAPAARALFGDAVRSAARSGQMAQLELALQQATAAQINAADDNGRTPLMLATLGGHTSAVQRLLTAGAEPDLKDAQGNTAAQMADKLGYTRIRNLLVKQPLAQ